MFGKLSDERFQKLSAQYEAEQKEIKTLASVLERENDGRKHVTIEVFFTYVGRIRIPLQKPELPTSKAQPA